MAKMAMMTFGLKQWRAVGQCLPRALTVAPVLNGAALARIAAGHGQSVNPLVEMVGHANRKPLIKRGQRVRREMTSN